MLRVVRLFGIICAGALVTSTLFAPPASARTNFTVSPGESIQAAIDVAHPDDVITLAPGTYNEALVVKADNITLIGNGATLSPPTTPVSNECSGAGGVVGICIPGVFDAHRNLQHRVANVRIEGLTVAGFSNSGIFGSGVDHLYVTGVTAIDNAVFGIVADFSLNSTIIDSTASGSKYGVAVTNSQDANVVVSRNDVHDNTYGIFLFDSRFGWISENYAQRNCLGLMVVETAAPSPSGSFDVFDNVLRGNTHACTDPGIGLTISGGGLVLAGSDNNRVHGNLIAGNVPSQPSPAAGGIVIVDTAGLGGDTPDNNQLRENVVFENEPFDLVLNSGTGNSFENNVCGTSSTGQGC